MCQLRPPRDEEKSKGCQSNSQDRSNNSLVVLLVLGIERKGSCGGGGKGSHWSEVPSENP